MQQNLIFYFNRLSAKLWFKPLIFCLPSMIDNAFDFIEDFEKAQSLADKIDIRKTDATLDKLSQIYCPVHQPKNTRI